MNIRAYLKKHDLSQDAFAQQIGVTQGAVWQWINSYSRVDARRAKDIEEKTNGEITRHDLRPDLYEAVSRA